MDELSMAGSAAVDEESKAVYVAASAAPWFHHPRRSLLPCGVLRPSPSWYQEQSLLQVSCNNEVRQKSPFLSYDRFAAAWTKCRIRVFPPSHLKVHPLQQYIWGWTSSVKSDDLSGLFLGFLIAWDHLIWTDPGSITTTHHEGRGRPSLVDFELPMGCSGCP